MNYISGFSIKDLFNQRKTLVITVYNHLKNPGKNLSERVVISGFWVFIMRIMERSLMLVCTIILARFLSPKDFGLFGIVMLSLSGVESFSQTGIDTMLIQKKTGTETYLNSAWVIQIFRGFVVSIILISFAPLIGTFFGEQRSILLIRVFAVGALLGSFGNIGMVYFVKELDFRKQFIYQFSATFANFFVAVIIAYLFRSVWALIFGFLTSNLVKLLMSYLVHPFRPKFILSWEKSKELFNFGKWLLCSSILVFLVTHGDDIFVGKALGSTALGLYLMAYKISNLPATEYSSLISMITFPAYSKLQDDITKLRKAYLKVLKISALLSVPIAGSIFILASDFTRIFLGNKWLPMVPAMRILALYGLFNSIVIPGPLFNAIGRPDLRTKFHLLNLIIMLIFIYPLTHLWGITGTAITVTIYIVLSGCFAMFVTFRIIDSGLKEPMKILLLPILNTLIVISLICVSKIMIFNYIGLAQFVLLVTIGILSYILIAFLFDSIFNYEAFKLLKEQLKVLSSKG